MSSSQSEYQSSGMLSREQLLHLFKRFSDLTSQPDVKKRIADAVNDNQQAVAVTTAIQEEILLEMGVDPRFGLAFLGKVNTAYENDQDLMIHFYEFVAKEEIACEEAELGPDKFAERMQIQQKLHEEQLEMLKHMRNFHLDDQSAILEKFLNVLDIVKRRVRSDQSRNHLFAAMGRKNAEYLQQYLHQQMEMANFDGEASLLSVEEIQDIVRRRVTPVYTPR